MPGGCHGHRGPMPAPAHMCCYATHQALAAVRIATSPSLLNDARSGHHLGDLPGQVVHVAVAAGADGSLLLISHCREQSKPGAGRSHYWQPDCWQR